jgi:diguanylate cyclase
MFSSLRTALLVPFVGVVVLVAIAISLLSYRTGLQAVDELSEQLLIDVSNRVTQATARHLGASSVALNVIAPDATGASGASGASGAASTLNELVPDTLPDFERRLWIASGLSADGNSYIYYGSNAGEFIGVNREAGKAAEVRVRELGADKRASYITRGPMERGQQLRTDAYDPRTRPWFIEATKRAALTWSSVYVGFTNQALTVTLAKPVFNRQNEQRGVVATDIALTALTDFVSSLKVSETGVAFIVEKNGNLVATSSKEPLFATSATQTNRVRADQSVNPLIRQAYAQYQGEPEKKTSLVRGIDIARYSFDSDSSRVHMSATAQRDSAGLDWTMVVAIPRSDYMGNVRRTILLNVGIGLLAVGLALVLGLWVLHRVALDLERLSDATRLLARGQSPNRLFPDRKDELGTIARSMEEFKAGLLIDPLTGALTRQTLEKRVHSLLTSGHGEPAATTEASSGFAVGFIDLDKFKRVNDQHGHAMGDAVLAVCAQRISSALRRDDLLARYGGDEFVLLLSGVTTDEQLNARLTEITRRLDQSIGVAGETIQAGASCGGALYPRDGGTLQQLVSVADERMFSMKKLRADTAVAAN